MVHVSNWMEGGRTCEGNGFVAVCAWLCVYGMVVVGLWTSVGQLVQSGEGYMSGDPGEMSS